MVSISLMISGIGHLFMNLWFICMFSWKTFYSVPLAFLKSIWIGGVMFVGLFCYCIMWILYIFWILTFYQMYDLQIFSPITKQKTKNKKPSFCWLFLWLYIFNIFFMFSPFIVFLESYSILCSVYWDDTFSPCDQISLFHEMAHNYFSIYWSITSFLFLFLHLLGT